MRSITLHSGAMAEILDSLQGKVAASLVPRQYGWVLVTLILAVLVLHVYMPLKIGKARKQYQVSYPNLYAEASNPNAKQFNCIQRGHQNSLEQFPMFLALLLSSGVKYPVPAALFGLAWIVGRLAYFQGYSTGDPKGRLRGNWGHIGELGLLVLVGATAYSLLLS